MQLEQWASKILGYDGPPESKDFDLVETDEEKEIAAEVSGKNNISASRTRQSKIRKPKKTGSAGYYNNADESGESSEDETRREIHAVLRVNKKNIEQLFNMPLNKDVVVREFTLSTEPPVQSFLVFIDGMADTRLINDSILKPLMLLTNLDPGTGIRPDNCANVLQKHLPSNQVKKLTLFEDVVTQVLSGATVIFFEGSPCAVSAETKGFPYRAVDTAKTEQVVQGPQEGFVENLRSNTSLIRRIIRSEKLITEYLEVGARNNNNVAIMYLSDLTDPDLLQEVKRRIKGIKTDYVAESGILEEFIEDHPLSLMPQIIKTERPDRVSSMLLEGKVAIIVDNTPFVMLVPGLLFDLLHSSEDHYVRFPHGVWLRMIRVFAVFLTILLPAFYVAIATFHQEMIPTDLLLSIASARELVPFPTIVEILLMELSFELVREAGVRVPGIIGPTLGIVGTLILGQAAVAASIVSPILIIIVAVTGLSSYAIPNYAASFGFRFMRFFFIFLATILGFFGISSGLFVLLCLLLNMKSFGVPYLAPVAPKTAPSADIILRLPAWRQETRPDYQQPLDIRRQPKLSRVWAIKKPNRPAGESENTGGDKDGNDTGAK